MTAIVSLKIESSYQADNEFFWIFSILLNSDIKYDMVMALDVWEDIDKKFLTLKIVHIKNSH